MMPLEPPPSAKSLDGPTSDETPTALREQSEAGDPLAAYNDPLAAYKPTSEAPWSIRRVVHLHWRAGLGADAATLARDLAAGPEASLDRLLHPVVDEERAVRLEAVWRAAAASDSLRRIQSAWAARLLQTDDPLGERLTLAWHDHFATAFAKVQHSGWCSDQVAALRGRARGQFADLLAAAVHSPAMLRWLDAAGNRAGQPNENLARELLELFTLGVGHYSDGDVAEAARALTGLAIRGDASAVALAAHDEGSISLFGHQGSLDVDGLLSLLVEHPATAQRLAWRLAHTFLAPVVATPGVLAALARRLQQTQLDIGDAVATLLRSQLFFSEANIATRVVDPATLVVATVRSLGLTDADPRLVALWTSRCGLELFNPPNVGGWPSGLGWLDTPRLVARSNALAAIAETGLNPARRFDAAALLTEMPPGFAEDAPASADHALASLLFGRDEPVAQTDSPAAALAAVLQHPRRQLH